MTPVAFTDGWVSAGDRGPVTADALVGLLAGLRLTTEQWAVFWGESAPGTPRPPDARASAVRLAREQNAAATAALAAAVATTPGLRAVVARTYTREYWLAARGGGARRVVAQRQARHLVAVAGPGWRLDPAWRTDTVVALARCVVGADAAAVVPVLADALEDAGCGDLEWLALMRDPAQPWFAGARVLRDLS